MRATEIIEKKRDGGELSAAEIDWFIQSVTAGSLPDYQAAALLMAIYIRGMTRRETVDLTQAMARSGDQLDLHDVVPYAVDKHSSGGVGDKTSLVVHPLVAACGVPVAKMSGRGLGFSGGTLDKMESISGWNGAMSLARFKQQVVEIGLVLAGQTAELAPADGKLYALRDVTGTVSSIPLIAASIMSKKLAAGSDGIVLDVKLGRGAFMTTLDSARELATTMVNIGRDAGRDVVALLSDMNQPLGHAVGNSLEVREAIDALLGEETTPADFWAHCLEVAGHMLVLAGAAPSLEEGKRLAAAARDDGRAFEKFRQMVAAQGGDVDQVDHPDRLPHAPLSAVIESTRAGYIGEINASQIGWSCVYLGAGRAKKGDPIDLAVGMIFSRKVGDHLQVGDPLGRVYARDGESLARAVAEFKKSITYSETPVEPLPLFYGMVGGKEG